VSAIADYIIDNQNQARSRHIFIVQLLSVNYKVTNSVQSTTLFSVFYNVHWLKWKRVTAQQVGAQDEYGRILE